MVGAAGVAATAIVGDTFVHLMDPARDGEEGSLERLEGRFEGISLSEHEKYPIIFPVGINASWRRFMQQWYLRRPNGFPTRVFDGTNKIVDNVAARSCFFINTPEVLTAMARQYGLDSTLFPAHFPMVAFKYVWGDNEGEGPTTLYDPVTKRICPIEMRTAIALEATWERHRTLVCIGTWAVGTFGGFLLNSVRKAIGNGKG